ncbi:hypothetical protein LX66_2961 [Chitinophaga japonensis]|uniref:Uncharacterized protein n=1 Tax=Chitinophaga japonensis TaxID=104662 RepID=A0A562T693_CHIJA|nr:hypothetical protein LX66_2961 [Chitinophaga japonensis]
MIYKDDFIKFLNDYFKGKRVDVKHFPSGCSMIDIYITEKDLICVQVEPSQIGISKIEDYPNYFDLSTISDNVFYSNADAENFILRMNI